MKKYLLCLSVLMPSLHAMMDESQAAQEPLAAVLVKAIIKTSTLQHRINLLYANLPWINGEWVRVKDSWEMRVVIRDAATFHFIRGCEEKLIKIWGENDEKPDDNHPAFNELIESNKKEHVALQAMIDQMRPHVKQEIVDEIWVRESPLVLELLEWQHENEASESTT